MSNKEMKTRIVHKHDLEKHWNNASNFYPYQGEIIIYDIETSINDLPSDRTELCTYERVKIGDGIHLVRDLPFLASAPDEIYVGDGEMPADATIQIIVDEEGGDIGGSTMDIETIKDELGIFKEISQTIITNNLCDGEYEWGSLESGGNEGSLTPENQGFRTANFLPVEGGKTITWNADLTTTGTINQFYCICEYDASKNLVLRTKTITNCVNKWDTGKGITLNANTRYVRFYIYNGVNIVNLEAIKINLFYVENINEFWQGAGDTFKYVPHAIINDGGEYIALDKIQSKLTGKKIVYDGDSICIGTYGGGGYAKIIADKVGGLYANQAVGGARLQTHEGSSSSFHSIVDNLVNLPTDADLYCFEGGVNDVWSSVSLGTYDMSDYTGVVDKTTICGALETIFRYCLDNFVGKPICFVITHKVSNINFDNYKKYHDSVIEICNKYSIPFYDAYSRSGLNGWNTAQNNAFLTGNINGTADGCHPNEDGYKKYYVPQLITLFESIMPIE